MKKKTKLIVILLMISIVLAASIYGVEFFNSQKNDKVIAKINGEKIYQSELEDKLSKMFQSGGQEKEQKVIISDLPKQLIEALAQDVYLQRELDKIAQASPVAKDQALQKQIENYKKTTIRQAYLESIVAKEVTDQSIKNKYSDLSSELSGKKELHLKHILVESEAEAQKVLSELKGKKSSFEKLAKEYSKDTSNAASGGDLGYVIPDNLDEEFAAVISGLKKGQVSDPIKTKYGWHIVKVEDVRTVELPSFEDAKKEIEANLKQEVVENLFNKIVKDVKVKILIDLKSQDPKALVPGDKAAENKAEETSEEVKKIESETKDSTDKADETKK